MLKTFDFDPTLAAAFLRFGFEHYTGDRGWIPPSKAMLRAQLAPEFDFYRKAGNHHRHFLCTSVSKVLGRVSAFVNVDLRDRDGTAVGTVGLFECVEDEGVGRELLGAATAWLAETHGLRRIWGPVNFDIWHGYRFLIRGFGQERFFGEPYNKPWYPELFARCGFAVKQEWATMEVLGRQAIEELIRPGEKAERMFVGRGYRFQPIDLSRFEAELDRLYDLVTGSFSGFLGFTPIGREEFGRLFAVSRHGIEPRFFKIALDETGNPVGLVGAFPDLAPAVRAMRGESHLLARLRFSLAPGRRKRLVVYMGGMLPGRARERAGLGRAGFHSVVCEALRLGCEHLLEPLVAKGSVSAALLGEHRHAVTREYALFELQG